MISKNKDGLPLYNFDRSRIEKAAQCQRAYYWNYGFLGLGIVKIKDIPPYWPFITGRYIHDGLEGILLGKPAKEHIDSVCRQYKDEYEPLLTGDGINPELSARLLLELEQELDLVKGLTYGWYLVGYPKFQESYQVVEGGIEQEESIGWIIGSEGEQCEVRLLTRTDMLARSRGSGLAMLFNFKSTSNPSSQWRDSFNMDMQTLTEAIAVENRLGIKVDGVVIEGLVKGSKKEWPPSSGFYQYNNSLIYAWVKDSTESTLPGEEGGLEYATSWEYTCTNPHIMGNKQRCPGGRNHTLGKGYKKRAVRDCFSQGVYGWIDYLVRSDPGTLESYFIQLPPISRDAYQVERWKRQTLMAEKVRQDMALYVDSYFISGDKQAAYEAMDSGFPQNSGWDCGSCMYKGLCWSAGDPFDENVWRGRVPNHPSELVNIDVGGE